MVYLYVAAVQTDISHQVGNDTFARHACRGTWPTSTRRSTQRPVDRHPIPKSELGDCLSVAISHSFLNPFVTTFDSRAGPNFVDESYVHYSWSKVIRPTTHLCLKSASNQPNRIGDKIELAVFMGDQHGRVSFGVVNFIFVKILLERFI